MVEFVCFADLDNEQIWNLTKFGGCSYFVALGGNLRSVQGLPRVWAEDRGSGIGGESPRQHQGASEVEGGVPGSTQGSSNRESRR